MKLKDRALNRDNFEDITIIDAHMHLGDPPFYVPFSDSTGVLDTMDLYGIDKGIVAPELAITCDMVTGNTEILDVFKHTKRLIPFCTISPHFPQKIKHELDRCFVGGAVGIKIHPSIHKTAVHDNAYYPVYEYASSKDIVVLTHSWGDTDTCAPVLWKDVLRDFPHLKIIFAHSGGNFTGLKQTLEMLKEYPENCFADIAGSHQYMWWIEQVCTEASAEQLIFGSDSPWIEPGFALGSVMFADISDTEKRMILGENISHLMGLD